MCDAIRPVSVLWSFSFSSPRCRGPVQPSRCLFTFTSMSTRDGIVVVLLLVSSLLSMSLTRHRTVVDAAVDPGCSRSLTATTTQSQGLFQTSGSLDGTCVFDLACPSGYHAHLWYVSFSGSGGLSTLKIISPQTNEVLQTSTFYAMTGPGLATTLVSIRVTFTTDSNSYAFSVKWSCTTNLCLDDDRIVEGPVTPRLAAANMDDTTYLLGNWNMVRNEVCRPRAQCPVGHRLEIMSNDSNVAQVSGFLLNSWRVSEREIATEAKGENSGTGYHAIAFKCVALKCVCLEMSSNASCPRSSTVTQTTATLTATSTATTTPTDSITSTTTATTTTTASTTNTTTATTLTVTSATTNTLTSSATSSATSTASTTNPPTFGSTTGNTTAMNTTAPPPTALDPSVPLGGCRPFVDTDTPCGLEAWCTIDLHGSPALLPASPVQLWLQSSPVPLTYDAAAEYCSSIGGLLPEAQWFRAATPEGTWRLNGSCFWLRPPTSDDNLISFLPCVEEATQFAYYSEVTCRCQSTGSSTTSPSIAYGARQARSVVKLGSVVCARDAPPSTSSPWVDVSRPSGATLAKGASCVTSMTTPTASDVSASLISQPLVLPTTITSACMRYCNATPMPMDIFWSQEAAAFQKFVTGNTTRVWLMAPSPTSNSSSATFGKWLTDAPCHADSDASKGAPYVCMRELPAARFMALTRDDDQPVPRICSVGSRCWLEGPPRICDASATRFTVRVQPSNGSVSLSPVSVAASVGTSFVPTEAGEWTFAAERLDGTDYAKTSTGTFLVDGVVRFVIVNASAPVIISGESVTYVLQPTRPFYPQLNASDIACVLDPYAGDANWTVSNVTLSPGGWLLLDVQTTNLSAAAVALLPNASFPVFNVSFKFGVASYRSDLSHRTENAFPTTIVPQSAASLRSSILKFPEPLRTASIVGGVLAIVTLCGIVLHGLWVCSTRRALVMNPFLGVIVLYGLEVGGTSIKLTTLLRLSSLLDDCRLEFIASLQWAQLVKLLNGRVPRVAPVHQVSEVCNLVGRLFDNHDFPGEVMFAFMLTVTLPFAMFLLSKAASFVVIGDGTHRSPSHWFAQALSMGTWSLGLGALIGIAKIYDKIITGAPIANIRDEMIGPVLVPMAVGLAIGVVYGLLLDVAVFVGEKVLIGRSLTRLYLFFFSDRRNGDLISAPVVYSTKPMMRFPEDLLSDFEFERVPATVFLKCVQSTRWPVLIFQLYYAYRVFEALTQAVSSRHEGAERRVMDAIVTELGYGAIYLGMSFLVVCVVAFAGSNVALLGTLRVLLLNSSNIESEAFLHQGVLTSMSNWTSFIMTMAQLAFVCRLIGATVAPDLPQISDVAKERVGILVGSAIGGVIIGGVLGFFRGFVNYFGFRTDENGNNSDRNDPEEMRRRGGEGEVGTKDSPYRVPEV